MTTDTTNDERKRGWRRLFPTSLAGRLIAVSVLVHVVAGLALAPFAVTRMRADREEERQRTEEVRKRELARKEKERELRQEKKLNPEQAKMLKREQERKRRDQMREKLEEIREAKKEIEKLRKKEFAALKTREAADLRFAQIDRLRVKAREMEAAAEGNFLGLAEATPGENDTTKAAHAKIDHQIEELAPHIDEWEPRLRALAAEATAHTARMKEFGEKSRKAHATGFKVGIRKATGARKTAEHAEALAALALSLLPEPDVAALNATPELPEEEPQEQASESDKTVAELYDEAKQLEQETAKAFADARAAEEAQKQGTSFEEERKKVSDATPSRPELSQALAGAELDSVGDYNKLREAMETAVNQARDMAARSSSLASQAAGRSQPGGSQPGQASSGTGEKEASSSSTARRQATLTQLARSRGAAVVDFTGVLGSGGQSASDTSMRRTDARGSSARNPAAGKSSLPKLSINQGGVQAQALPGRMLTAKSLRAGWLYIDTWYVIGPWENNEDLYFTKKHPPEDVIDFDAKYFDGKFANTPGHPDQVLSWQFYQSDQIRNEPPRVYDAATWYAYTEIFSDEAREVLIAIASDDAAKVWINGNLISDDSGGSIYKMGEGFRKVPLEKGFNKVLVRLENGPLYAVWSLLLCPPSLIGEGG